LGRSKSNYICPDCGERGYIASTPTKYGIYQRVMHYDHKTGSRRSCYIDKILEKRKIDKFRSMPDFKIHQDQKLPLRELAYRTYMYYKDIGIDLHKLNEKIKSNHITHPIIIQMVNLLWKYLRLYVKGYLPFNTYKMNTFEFLEYLKNEKILVDILKKLPKILVNEYKILLKKGSLIDSGGSYRHTSNYKIKEGLRRRLKSIRFEISLVEKHNYFSDIFRFQFLLDLALEYWFIKYDIPKKMKNRKNLSDILSKGAFGSEKYRSQY
jgi:hypothetical protein